LGVKRESKRNWPASWAWPIGDDRTDPKFVKQTESRIATFTTIDAAVIVAKVKQYRLKLAPSTEPKRGSAQRACLMNLDGTPEDRIAAILAQPQWKGESESDARVFVTWFIKKGYLRKDLAQTARQRADGLSKTGRLEPHYTVPDYPLTLGRADVDIPAAASASLSVDSVLSRINNFWGYGALSAPVWFVGMEESIPSTVTILCRCRLRTRMRTLGCTVNLTRHRSRLVTRI
jgi:hypothetical protein